MLKFAFPEYNLLALPSKGHRDQFSDGLESVLEDGDADPLSLVLPDMHANSLRLMNNLNLAGIADIDEATYAALIANFQRSESEGYGKKDIDEFERILDGITWHKRMSVCLLGDLLADRRGNDLLMLLVLEHMANAGIEFDIMLSNHDFEFIRWIEEGKLSEGHISKALDLCFYSSLTRLVKLIKIGDVSEKRVLALYNSIYKPRLKLIGFDGSSFYAHAPISFEQAQALATQFDVILTADMSSDAKRAAINQINRAFQDSIVKSDQLKALYDANVASIQNLAYLGNYGGAARSLPYGGTANPVAALTWQRTVEFASNPEGYHQVHGHVGVKRIAGGDKLYTNLDSNLGKADDALDILNIFLAENLTVGCAHDSVVPVSTLAPPVGPSLFDGGDAANLAPDEKDRLEGMPALM